MIPYKKLAFTFDKGLMQQEALGFAEDEWIPHFNTGYYNGDWSAIPLRSPQGDPRRIFPDPTGLLRYDDTAHLERCAYLGQVINSFACDKTAVRLLRLKAGSVIKEHRDFDLSFEDGEVRLHVPITTNPSLEFYLDKQRIIMDEGETWYLNFNLRHSVSNNGETDRIHLVMDCVVNDWVKQQFT